MNFSNTFTSAYSYVEGAIQSSVASFGSGLVTFVAAPLGVAATIYFLLLGFAVLRGAIQAPLRELVFQAGKVGFAIAAASSVGYSTFVVNVVTGLPDQIISAGSGTAVSNPGKTFDLYVADTQKLSFILNQAEQRVDEQSTSPLDIPLALEKLKGDLIVFLCTIVLYFFSILSGCIGFCIVIYAKLAVSICVALAPLALGCLLFNSSRWLFDGWLKQTTNYVLLMVVMAIMTKFITAMETTVFASIVSSAGDGSGFTAVNVNGLTIVDMAVVSATVAGILIYTIGTFFFFQSPSIAAGIAGGASSGGHAFLEAGMNTAMNRVMFRKAFSGGRGGGSGSGRSAGGSVNKG